VKTSGLPNHLKRYTVEQDYSRYTPVDQAVWRYIMRQLTAFLKTHAHPCYLEGLKKSGIEVDRIPEISHMSEKLAEFGWRAVPVSGFIPPAAFMEMQAHGFLPIAADLRTIDHLTYTPAPDIVHEAAGHAPILIDRDFAAYLKAYAQVASKAIISREDMELYEVIRLLSDLKEDPDSTAESIAATEKRLTEVSRGISHISEAAYLARMNWWTAEYGLIGDLKNPRIFGAGLLSSVGEASECLSAKVKKIPLTIDCLNYSYDITEPQPQLFVTPNFATLLEVLEQMAATMAYRTGGLSGLQKAKLSQTVNTVQLNSGLQISGLLQKVITESGQPAYLNWQGPTQLCSGGRELQGQGASYHAQGFGSPLGLINGVEKCLSEMSDGELKGLGLAPGSEATLRFQSDVVVTGKVLKFTRDTVSRRLLLMSFENCRVTLRSDVLFDPSWGIFDMAVGSSVTSVFGGAADRVAFGISDDFVAKTIPRKKWTPKQIEIQNLYQAVRSVREKTADGSAMSTAKEILQNTLHSLNELDPQDWLLRLEIREEANKLRLLDLQSEVDGQLSALSKASVDVKTRIDDGLRVMH
jgi:phenylalanine-4-hydroxylase